LPRTGNTLFGSLMNQNPDVAVSANSITASIMGELFKLKHNDIFKNYPDHKSLDNLAYHVFDLYYKDWNYKYIIDRAPWGLPINLKFLKETRKNIKIIVLVRDVIEILASIIRFSQRNPDAYINRSWGFRCGDSPTIFTTSAEVLKGGVITPEQYKAKNIEEKCYMLMHKDGLIVKELMAIKHLLLPQNKGLYHIVEYNDLVEHPKRTLEGVYDYLEIPKFKHRYINLDQFEVNGMKYDDTVVGEGLHTIKTDSISKSKYDAYSIIPKNIIEKYQEECNILNFF